MRSLTFGTDGIRGHASEFPFTPADVYYLGRAIGAWMHTHYEDEPRVLIASDTRASGLRIKNALMLGLDAARIPYIDAGILPSPAALALIQDDHIFNMSLVISASHNPAHDNGIKFFDRVRGKISKQDEVAIADFFSQFTTQNNYIIAPELITERTPLFDALPTLWYERYKSRICARFAHNMLAGYTIVLDCAHGAAYTIAPDIFRTLGAHVITRGCEPTGFNINAGVGALHPESLQKAVIDAQAHVGIAFDGDADRVLMVNRIGEIKDGDDILAILLSHPTYAQSSAIVGTIMSNHGLATHCAARGKQFHRTAVGDKFVTEKLLQDQLLLGGETSGHIIMTDYLACGDGIFAALRTLETMIITDNWDMVSYEKLPQVALTIKVDERKNLAHEPFCSIIKSSQAQLPQGRIVVRFSGTEDVLRIMTEDQNVERAQHVAQELAQKLKAALAYHTPLPHEERRYEI